MSDFNYTQFPIPAKPLSGVGETNYASAILGIAPGGVKKIPTESFLASAGIYPVGLLQCSVPTPVQVYGAGDDEFTLIPVMADTSVSGGSTGVSTGGLSIVTTGANAGGVSVSEAGLYRISAAVRVKRGTGTSFECGCLVVKNGTTPLSVVYDEADTDEAFSIVCPTVVASLASGDVISLNGAYLGGSSDYVIFAPGTAWETLPIASTSVLVIERLNNSYGSSSGTPSLAEVAAEVEDIREGYDGTEYASAGEAVRAQIQQAMAQGIDDSVKQALLNCFNHVAWIDADGQDYVDALEDALYPDAELSYITAEFDPVSSVSLSGVSKIGGYFTYNNTVATATWVSSENSYTIAIPVTVGDKYKIKLSNTDSGTVGTIFRAGFSSSNTPRGQHISGLVVTTPQADSEIELVATGTYLVIQFSNSYGDSILSNGYLSVTQTNLVYEQDSLDSLKPDLVVTGHWSDSSTTTITAYTLSGTLSVGTSAVTVTYQGKTTTFNATVINPYQYVEYIENPSDTNSWIELDVVPSNTFGFKATVALAERTGDTFVFGTREVDAGRILLGYNANSSKPYFGWGSRSGSPTPTTGFNTQFVASLNYKNSRNGQINSYNTFTSNIEALAFTPTWKYVVLGTRLQTGTYTGKQQKLYGMEITVDSVVIMNLKPCYRTSDNAIGLYDEINGIFYGNSGTGNLSKGADVNG